MSMTKEETRFHEQYEQMTEEQRGAIDRSFAWMKIELENAGFKCASDDRAECLVAAIVRYTEDSKR